MLIAISNGVYYVNTEDGIFEYSKEEMEEIYNFKSTEEEVKNLSIQDLFNNGN